MVSWLSLFCIKLCHRFERVSHIIVCFLQGIAFGDQFR